MLCSMAFQSKLCAALHGQSNIGSMCDCKACGSFDLVGFPSGVGSDHGTGPKKNCSVNSRSTLCPIEGSKGHADQRLSFKLSPG